MLVATSNAVVDAVTSGLTTVQGDMLSTFTAVLPGILAVVGAVLVARFGIRFFKGLAK